MAASGERAVTVFAADKLSDIRGLRSGIAMFGGSIEQQMDAGVADLADHYRESVDVIEAVTPDSPFLPALRVGLGQLERAKTSQPPNRGIPHVR